ncbi:putative Inositol-phosphate phosphatase [Nitrospira sp. KM1]|uniref:3'(2'),5'-bisphosphate nucleotidase CysQ n=1 Tax=Nitrospira sp. KM1 TaxID=1936990 RepID=UPI0013A74289|nr:3'(2'),5'-bisphosphate nucleotidase CysQ [Nitrospira sp. KM1]BCA55199.1 putative Inositol-phosphate phosphatase [Nitrospira sp. KM1]
MEPELIRLTEAIRQAGTRSLELAKLGFEVHTKKDHSPVTTADLEVNAILHRMQQEHFPSDGWLSEESPDDLTRLNKSRVWIVDPIDGTKAYVNRLPEFCISVALVENRTPVLAAILNPSTRELFTAIRGKGLSLNGKPLSPPPQPDDRPVVLVSPWELRTGRWSAMEQSVHCRPILSIASALALVAAGRAQASLTIESENEWDLAAGVLLIVEAGGSITDGSGRAFVFNQPTPRFHGVVAVAGTAEPGLRRALEAHAATAREKKAPS